MQVRHRDEASLKTQCLKLAKEKLPKFVILPHEDVRHNGYPDWSVSGLGMTSWLEFKHGTPHFDSYGLQELTMLRLDTASRARYVLYLEDDQSQRTLIVRPKHFKDLLPEVWCAGFDHQFVLDYVYHVHAYGVP